MSDGTPDRPQSSGFFSMGFMIFVGLAIAFGTSMYMVLSKADEFKKFGYLVPIIFIFIAIAVFLMLLLHYAVIIRQGQANFETAALGLPEGSIRAFLALALIVLVGVFGSFIFFETRGTGTLQSVRQLRLAESEVARVRESLPSGMILAPTSAADAGTPPTRAYDILSVEANPAQIDIAKQLLTMIVTVLTTVLGFYFGSRGAEARTDLDSGVKRGDALVAIQDTLIRYDDVGRSLDGAVVQMQSAAVKGLADPTAQASVQAELARIEKKRQALAGRAESVKAARENPLIDLKGALAAREDAARLLADATKLKADLDAAAKDADLASPDPQKRVAVLKKV